MSTEIISDAEIAGFMGWHGPGAYTQNSLRKIKRIVEEVRVRTLDRADSETLSRLQSANDAINTALQALGPAAPDCCGCASEWQVAIDALSEANHDHIADSGKVIPQFIPVGIVNDHHSITWIEEIVEDQAPIGAILYALQDSVGRNVSFADETVCNWRQPTYDHSDANYWDADCGKSWAITEGTPTENGMKFCHGCGKPIKEHPFVDSEDEQ